LYNFICFYIFSVQWEPRLRSRLKAGLPGNFGCIHCRGETFFFSLNLPTLGCSFLRVKQLEREDTIQLPSAENKMKGAMSLLPQCAFVAHTGTCLPLPHFTNLSGTESAILFPVWMKQIIFAGPQKKGPDPSVEAKVNNCCDEHKALFFFLASTALGS
jgi:hypothetical protein